MKKINNFFIILVLVIFILFFSCQEFISSDVYSKPVYYQSENELLFAASYKGEERLFILNKDKKTLQHILPDINNILLPTYSQELNLIAFGQINEDQTNSNIWITDPEGKNRTQLTDTNRLEERPFFSNDSKYVYYLKHDIGQKYFINRVNLKTLKDEQITNESFWIMGIPVLSLDDRFIFFSKARDLTDEILIKYDSKSKSAKELTREGYGYMPFINKNNQLCFAGRNYTYKELSAILGDAKSGQTGFISGIYMLLSEEQEWRLLMKFPWEDRYIQYSPFSEKIMLKNYLLIITEIDLITGEILGEYDLTKIPLI